MFKCGVSQAVILQWKHAYRVDLFRHIYVYAMLVFPVMVVFIEMSMSKRKDNKTGGYIHSMATLLFNCLLMEISN